MQFRGIINIDFTGADSNQQTRLSVALRKDGWTHVETSAFVRETSDINDLWRGIALVAKQASTIGAVSALTFHIQSSKDFNQNVNSSSTLNPENALAEILEKPFPGIA